MDGVGRRLDIVMAVVRQRTERAMLKPMLRLQEMHGYRWRL